MPFTWVTVRPGRSTPADLVQLRFSQTGPRSVSELESVLTLVHSVDAWRMVGELEVHLLCYFVKRLHISFHVYMYTMYTFTLAHLGSTNETDRRRPRPMQTTCATASTAFFSACTTGLLSDHRTYVACAADVSIWWASFGLVFVDF